MAFRNERFPDKLSYAFSGGPGERTQVHDQDSGFEQRVKRWPAPRWRWVGNQELEDQKTIYETWKFYLAVGEGAANSWRFKDLQDNTSSKDDGVSAPGFADQEIGIGDGSKTQFQLIKEYEHGAETRVRVIQTPVVDEASGGVPGDAMSVRVGLDTGGGFVEQAGNWTVDGTTGIITFTSAPAVGAVVAAGFRFDAVARFSVDDDEHRPATFAAFDAHDVDDIQLIEVRQEAPYPERLDPGGLVERTLTASIGLSLSTAKYYRLDTAAGLSAYLPVPSFLGDGWELFVLENIGSNTYTIRDDTGASVDTVAASAIKRVSLRDNGDGTKTWVVN